MYINLCFAALLKLLNHLSLPRCRMRVGRGNDLVGIGMPPPSIRASRTVNSSQNDSFHHYSERVLLGFLPLCLFVFLEREAWAGPFLALYCASDFIKGSHWRSTNQLPPVVAPACNAHTRACFCALVIIVASI